MRATNRQRAAGRPAVPRRPVRSPPTRRRSFGARRIAAWLAGLGVLVALGVGLVQAADSGAAGRWRAPAIAADLVVARVHAESVTWTVVATQMRAAAVMGRSVPTDMISWRAAVRTTLDSIVGDVLVRHFLEGQGVYVPAQAIDAAVANVRRSFGSDAEFERAMRQMHVSMADLRETQRRGLYLQALIDRVVPVADSEIDAFLAGGGNSWMDRQQAGAQLRNERAAPIVAQLIERLRADPGVWLIDVNSLN